MRQLIIGIILGSVLTTGLGMAGSNFYKSDGTVDIPYGSVKSFDYYRQRQSWLDIAASRRAAEQIARDSQLHPCGR